MAVEVFYESNDDDPKDYSDSIDLAPLDMGLFDHTGAKFPSTVSIKDLNEHTKATLLQIIDDFQQAKLADQESKKYRSGIMNTYYQAMRAGHSMLASNQLGGLLSLNQQDGHGMVPLQLMAWRIALREHGADWKERIETNDQPKPIKTGDTIYDDKPYHSVISIGHLAAHDYGDI